MGRWVSQWGWYNLPFLFIYNMTMNGKIECCTNVKIMHISSLNSMNQLLNQEYETKISDQ